MTGKRIEARSVSILARALDWLRVRRSRSSNSRQGQPGSRRARTAHQEVTSFQLHAASLRKRALQHNQKGAAHKSRARKLLNPQPLNATVRGCCTILCTAATSPYHRKYRKHAEGLPQKTARAFLFVLVPALAFGSSFNLAGHRGTRPGFDRLLRIRLVTVAETRTGGTSLTIDGAIETIRGLARFQLLDQVGNAIEHPRGLINIIRDNIQGSRSA